MNTLELEAGIVDALAAEKPDFKAIIHDLHTHGSEGVEVYELAVDGALEKDDRAAAHAIVGCYAEKLEGSDGKAQLKELLFKAYGKSPETRAMLESVGLDEKIAAAECFRRFDLLHHLEPGVLCFERAWGVGEVKEVDHFYKHVIIDFPRKKFHEMSFSYCAEALLVLEPGHILHLKYAEPETFKQMLADQPSELVKMYVQDFGEMPLSLFQEKFTEMILDGEHWKSFWERARKQLKNDKDVKIPTKRNDPLQIIDHSALYTEAWFETLQRDTDMKSILKQMQELYHEAGADEWPGNAEEIITDRLSFVARGSEGKFHSMYIQALTFAEEWSLKLHGEAAEGLHGVCNAEQLIFFSPMLTARDIRILYKNLVDLFGDEALDAFISALDQLPVTALNEAMSLLLEQENREQVLADKFKGQFTSKMLKSVLVNWLYKNPAYIDRWLGGQWGELAELALSHVEEPASGEQLKIANQLRENFVKADWVSKSLGAMRDTQRQSFMERVKNSPGWDTVERRSVMGAIIKLFPELGKVVTDQQGEAETKKGSVTSHRMYNERKAQLEKIQKEDIPNNSKEIGIARSYGDLRENFEFKAAKEMQSVLFRRESELGTMLEEITPTDFKGYDSSNVGVATEVVLAYEDGREETYYILGVWDRDEALGIISCESQMAKALEGHVAGDEVTVPAEQGNTVCTVKEVGPLPEKIQAWLTEGS